MVRAYAVNALNAVRGQSEGAYRVNGVYRVDRERDREPSPNAPQLPGDTESSSAAGPDPDEVESPEATATCYACGGTRFWVSTFGDCTCGNCHPPANPRLVDRWIEGDVD